MAGVLPARAQQFYLLKRPVCHGGSDNGQNYDIYQHYIIEFSVIEDFMNIVYNYTEVWFQAT